MPEMSDIIKLPGGYYQPGLSFTEYRNLSRSLEDDLPVVNNSILKHETTIDMRAEVYPDPETEAKNEGAEHFVVGDALHKAVLEPEYLEREEDFFLRCETSGLNTKASRTARELFPEKIIIDKEGKVLELAKRMRDALYEDPQIRPFLEPPVETFREITGVAMDPGGQFVRKIRVDLLPGIEEDSLEESYILDIKTVDSRSFMPSKYVWHCKDRRYYQQAAYYLDTDSIIRTGSPDHPRKMFLHAVVEKSFPYKTMLYRLMDEKIEEARQVYQERMAMLAHAIRHNEWQGFEYRAPFPI